MSCALCRRSFSYSSWVHIFLIQLLIVSHLGCQFLLYVVLVSWTSSGLDVVLTLRCVAPPFNPAFYPSYMTCRCGGSTGENVSSGAVHPPQLWPPLKTRSCLPTLQPALSLFSIPPFALPHGA